LEQALASKMAPGKGFEPQFTGKSGKSGEAEGGMGWVEVIFLISGYDALL
jgi:hypothetical protein